MTVFSRNTLSAALVSVGIVAAGTVQAAADVTKERQDAMSHVGAATKAAAAMAKGEVPFDAVAAELALRTMNATALGFKHMFPEGSETGSNTEAGPAIWSDRAGFDAAVDKFIADTGAKVTDEASFKAAFGAATGNCGSCHKAYRVKN